MYRVGGIRVCIFVYVQWGKRGVSGVEKPVEKSVESRGEGRASGGIRVCMFMSCVSKKKKKSPKRHQTENLLLTFANAKSDYYLVPRL